MARGVRPHHEDYPDDDALIEAIVLGDRTAFRVLMETHAAAMLKVAQRFLGNQSDADEVVQDAFLKVWTSADAWRPGGDAKLSTWLYRIVINKCIDRHRRGRVFTALDDSFDPPDPGANGLDQLINRKAADVIVHVLAGLSLRHREILSLYYMADLSAPEVARSLGLSLAAVESLLSRGRRAVRTALARRGITSFGELL